MKHKHEYFLNEEMTNRNGAMDTDAYAKDMARREFANYLSQQIVVTDEPFKGGKMFRSTIHTIGDDNMELILKKLQEIHKDASPALKFAIHDIAGLLSR